MSDYSGLDKLLHRVVLTSPAMGEILADIEGALAGRAAPAEPAPVLVTGLARAGTTVLMRALHASGAFASLTYADMPMVMAPNLWARLTRGARQRRRAVERAHGDGILVDFDAPEALEEVFWRARCGRDYIRPDGLVPHVPSPEVLADYAAFRARVCRRHGAGRYLAKNNNAMLRLLPLARAIPEAVFLIPVRAPLAQAASLRAQHRRFRDADAFTRAYMGWLVHHEFGPLQRPFRLPGQPVPEGDRDGLDYWLTLWVACYGYLAEQIEAAGAAGLTGLRPVVYEDLGSDPQAWARVAAAAGIAPGAGDFRPAADPPAASAAPDLVARAEAIYAALRARSRSAP